MLNFNFAFFISIFLNFLFPFHFSPWVIRITDSKQRAEEKATEKKNDDWDDEDGIRPTPVRKRKPVKDWSDDEEIQSSQIGARKKLNFELKKKKKRNDGLVQESQFIEDETDDSD